MGKAGPFPYRLEEREVVAAAKVFMRKRLMQPPTRWLLVAIVILATLLIVIDLLDGKINLASLAVAVAAPLVIVLAVRVFAPQIARRQFRQSAALRDEHIVSFDAETLTFAGSRGTVTFPLAELHAFTDMPGLLLIHQTEGFYNPIPKRALGDEAVKALSDSLSAAGVTQW